MNDVILKNVRVFNGQNIIEDLCDIIVEGGVIVCIVASKDKKYSGYVIDCKGAIASIGFIDFHVHIYPMAEMGV